MKQDLNKLMCLDLYLSGTTEKKTYNREIQIFPLASNGITHYISLEKEVL